MYILITGVAGFVGFNFANELIKKKKLSGDEDSAVQVI